MSKAAVLPHNATVIPDGYVRFHFGLSVIASPTIEGMREIATRFTNTQLANANPAPAPANRTQTNQQLPNRPKRKISAASRKRMADAQNKRWAEKKAAGGAAPVEKATKTRKAAKQKSMTAGA
jgi:hypothetical protein